MRRPVPAAPAPPLARSAWLVAAVVAAIVVSLALYLPTMPPTITWWFGGSDSGDLVSAADVLGVPHPTGYPLFVLLGYLATRLPFGEVAVRVNAMNAILGALGAGGVVLAVWHLVPADRRLTAVCGLVGALAVATSSLYWSQAVIGEVYALHAALVSLIVWLWVRPGTHPAVRGAAHGLSLTNHLTAAILLGAALVAYGRGWWRERAWRPALWFLLGVLAPLTLYLLLPIRAAQDPPANWGDPDSLGRLLDHVTGRQYRAYVDPLDVGGTLRDLPALLRLVVGDLPPFTLPLAAVGVTRLWRTRREDALFTGLSVAGVWLFTAIYRTPDRAPYLLPAYLVLGVWCGVGLVACVEVARTWAGDDARRRLLARAGGALVVLALAGWALRTGLHVNLRGDDSAIVFARATLAPLPPGGTYYSARDDVTFALWYAQRSLGIRPDVYVVDVRNPQLTGAP